MSTVEEKAVFEKIVQRLDATEFEDATKLCSTEKYILLSDFFVFQFQINKSICGNLKFDEKKPY